MDHWIKELWTALDKADWGTRDLIGAVDDLLYLSECGLVDRHTLDIRLQSRYERDLSEATKAEQDRQKKIERPSSRSPTEWRQVFHGTPFEDREAA